MMTLEGILSIQAGDNPRLVSEKLMSYVPPAERSAATSRTWPTSTSRPGRPEHGRADTAAGAVTAAREEGSNERWLLTYADMITLLMALFMVLFSISSVNISKYQTLQKSLKAAFSGNILPGGKAISQQGATEQLGARALEHRTAGDRAGQDGRLEQPAEQHHARRGERPIGGGAAGAGPIAGPGTGGGVRAHQAASSTPTRRRMASPRA